ncbi:MAG: outer membrane lipoprotein [Desulfobacteraceae bacterium Eth-SRB2]|nr:MAG: outer membrane lipoprotein [Desulfobacteraceae bacterium Eth-SRB2]
MRKVFCAIIIPACIFIGCAPVISKGLRREISRDITFKKIIEDPDTCIGKTVLISGIILGSKNTKEGTLIEILQKPADMEGRPKDVDESDGRFLALYNGYLDTVIYSRGREAAIAGEIKGKRVLPLDEIEYTYPLISIKEIHLFKPQKEKYYAYPYPHWYYPPWCHYPYWYPW